MPNALFNELVKLALEKKAYGYGGYGGYFGGRRGRGRGFGLFTHPAAVPGMVRGQYAQLASEGADAPERGIGAERDWEQESGLTNRTPTTYDKQISDQMSQDEIRRNQQVLKEQEQARAGLGQGIGEQNKLHDDLRALKSKYEGLQSAYQGRGLWGQLTSAIGFGSGQSQYDELQRAKADYENARQSLPTQMAARQRLVDLNQNTLGQAEQRRMQYETRSGAREEGAYGRMSDIDTSLEGQRRQQAAERQQGRVSRRNIAGAAGARAIGQPGPAPVTPAPTPGTPGGPAAAPAPHVPIPQSTAIKPVPPTAPLRPVTAAVFMPMTSMDNLIEGAARSMFDRYVKIATAKVAAETIYRPEMAAKTPPKPQVLTTQRFQGKQGPDLKRELNASLTGKRTNVPGSNPKYAAALLGQHTFQSTRG